MAYVSAPFDVERSPILGKCLGLMGSSSPCDTIVFMKTVACILSLLFAGTTAAMAQNQTSPRVHIRGTLSSVHGDMLSGTSTTGAWNATLAPSTRVFYVVKSDLRHVRAGEFIGSAAIEQRDGTLLAREVHIFPESMRGTGEGFHSYDLGPHSSMTNATIATISSATVDAVNEQVLTVKYNGGEKRLVLRNDTPVVAFVPANDKALVPGAHVAVFGEKHDDGSVTADSVGVGKSGLVPPM
jgi:hypothetical protein